MSKKNNNFNQKKINEIVLYIQDGADIEVVDSLTKQLDINITDKKPDEKASGLMLYLDSNGLSLIGNGQTLRGDFTQMLSRVRLDNLNRELLIKASKIKGSDKTLTIIDATAGLGEDSFLLAAAGFSVKLYEHDVIIAALLQDALRRASLIPELSDIVNHMQLFAYDSVTALQHLDYQPDVVFLDPMFPARQKSALIKKKFQVLQQLEHPCSNEDELLQAAFFAHPRKIVIKRPLKGSYLANHKPSYSLKGKSIRYDCIILP